MYPPNSWPFPSPNPPVGHPDQDETARWGEGTPLPVKLADAYPGKAAAGSTTVVVAAAAVGLPREPYAVSMVCQVQTAPIRWRVDGVAPTATAGFRADPGDILAVTGPEDLLSFQMIREGAVSAAVVCQPYV